MSYDYAIIRLNGKQYPLTVGSRFLVDRMPVAEGEEIHLSEVLFAKQGEHHKVGAPTISGVRVTAQVLGHTRGPKIIVFKKRPKKGYKRLNGHRQELTELTVKEIVER